MNAFEFSKQAIHGCSKFSFVQEIEIQLLDEPVVKIKAFIDANTFINIFYNAETLKYSFALVRNNKRIFGADNTRNWHIHPFENPDSHLETTEMSLADFFKPMFDSDRLTEKKFLCKIKLLA
jgi:hypothetical protein